LSQLQDEIGDRFKKLGFSRGVKKTDRIKQTLEAQGLDPAAYAAMSPAEKAKVKGEANVRHKTVRALHSELKNDLFRLDNAIQQGLGLFDLVVNSQPDDLEAIKTQVAAEDDKIVSRFFTYAMRMHNAKADQDKTVKHLENTIEKLGQTVTSSTN